MIYNCYLNKNEQWTMFGTQLNKISKLIVNEYFMRKYDTTR